MSMRPMGEEELSLTVAAAERLGDRDGPRRYQRRGSGKFSAFPCSQGIQGFRIRTWSAEPIKASGPCATAPKVGHMTASDCTARYKTLAGRANRTWTHYSD